MKLAEISPDTCRCRLLPAPLQLVVCPLALAALALMLLSGCGSYSHQAQNPLSEAKSVLLASAQLLDDNAAGRLSRQYFEGSLTEYQRTLADDSSSLSSISAPPDLQPQNEAFVAIINEASGILGQELAQPGSAGAQRQAAGRLQQLAPGLELP